MARMGLRSARKRARTIAATATANEKPQADGAGAKSGQVAFMRRPKGNGLTPPIQCECSAGVSERAAGDFHPMLENSRKPCGKRVERRWIERKYVITTSSTRISKASIPYLMAGGIFRIRPISMDSLAP
jgi:hypothetical protein